MASGAIIGVLSPLLGRVIDRVFPDSSEATEARAELERAIGDIDARITEAASATMVADSQSDSDFTRNTRPLVVRTCLGLLVAIFAVAVVSPDHAQRAVQALEMVPSQLWTLITVGIGAYHVARSFDKGLRR